MTAADTDDFADLLAALPQPDPRQVWQEIEAARRAAAAAPPPEPSIIPPPEHVYPPGHRWWWRFLAFPCAHRCGWAHLEDLLLNDLEDAARPFVIPAGTVEDVTRAITAHADARAEEQRRRIEDAIREHLGSAHSDHDSVRTLEVSPRLSPPSCGRGPAFLPPRWRGRSMCEESRERGDDGDRVPVVPARHQGARGARRAAGVYAGA